MSEHVWARKNIATYLAGGLEAGESDRLERHTASCPECARALAEARAVDQTLETLFAEVRPEPGLEDRLIRALRHSPRRVRWSLPWYGRLAMTAAALVVLGVSGTVMSGMIQKGTLPFPNASGLNSNRLVLVDGSQSMEDREQVRSSIRQFGFATQALESYPFRARFTPEGDLKSAGEMAQALEGKLHDGLQAVGTPPRSDNHLRPLKPEAFGGRSGAIRDPEIGKSLETAGKGTQSGLKVENAESGKDVPRIEDLAVPAPAAAPQPPASFYGTTPGGTSTATGVVTAPPPGSGYYFKPLDLATGLAKEAKPQSGAGAAAGGGTKEEPGKEISKPAARPAVPPPGTGEPGGPAKQPEPPAPANPRKIIIRSGDMEFEVESFDSAVATITKLVGDPKMGGFVDTVNSEKLPNGKVKGVVVVRVPPEHLDTLVLDLRKELGKGGELKGQRIASQDITKQYTDLESRLRAARAMEERLLQIIKTGKGEIKDLLQAEKELGVWRTKIEEVEGELRYYRSLVSMSTLKITLAEKEIRAPFAIIETEHVNMGVEVEDVDKARQEALDAVAAAKGRVTKADFKQHSAGQFSATLNFEVAPEQAGPLRDRLKQLGHVARLEIDRTQKTEGGTGRPLDAKLKRGDAQFQVNFYNLANVAPRETVSLNLACTDVEVAYKTILDRVRKASGRVIASNLSRQPNEQTEGKVQCEIKAAEAEAVLRDFREAGEVMSLQVTENPDTQNVTTSKRGFTIQLLALGRVKARETAKIQLAVADVPAAYRALQDAVTKANGRVLKAQLNEQDKQNVTADFDFEVRRDEEDAVSTALAAAGDIYARTVTRAPSGADVVNSKLAWEVKLMNQSAIPPRETVTLGIEVSDVDKTAAAFTAYVAESKGRTVSVQMARKPDGRVTARLVFDVPRAAAAGLVERFKAAGAVRAQESSQNPQVPDSKLAVTRLEVTLSNAELIVPSDEGFWPQIRTGLKTSFVAISWSLTVVIIGLCFVLPWAVVIYAVYLVVRRLRRKAASATP